MPAPSRRVRVALSATLLLVLTLARWLVGQPFAASPTSARDLAAPASGPRLPVAETYDPTPDGGLLDAGLRAAEEGPPLEAVSPEIVTVPARTPPLSHTLNVLLVGVDRRRAEARGGRPDTLVLAVFDERTDHLGLVSIPRDLYVDIPGHGPARINASFGVARREGANELDLLKRVVEDTLALPIRHVASVDLGGFERIVDAVGGVTLEVPCPIDDRFHDPRAPGGLRDLHVSAGRVHLDGATAAMYVRSRHGRSDWSRARRQQAVLFALRRQLLEGDALGRLPSLWRAVGDMVTTDMRRIDLLALAHRVSVVDPSHVHGLLLGHREVVSHRTPEGREVLLPDYAGIDRALASLFEAPAPGRRPGRAVCPAADVALRPRAPRGAR